MFAIKITTTPTASMDIETSRTLWNLYKKGYNTSFEDFHSRWEMLDRVAVFTLDNKEVVGFIGFQFRPVSLPAAPLGMPIAWKGHYYARAGESLTHLGLDKLDNIRQQTMIEDWSAQIILDGTFDHLDTEALQKARESFAQKYANRFSSEEVMGWPMKTFLDRAKLTQDGRITRTTILLLGKPESAYLLSPHPGQITWKLEGPERAYEHFGLPFFLNTTSVYRMIRNIQVRILPDDQLFAVEVSKYDQRIVLEALHNCIAHQDYSRNGRIIVTEQPDCLYFENEGRFFEGLPEDYIIGNKTPRRYRNPFLAQAMAELNMIDTMGYGIHSIHVAQARRFFPMPDFDLERFPRIHLFNLPPYSPEYNPVELFWKWIKPKVYGFSALGGIQYLISRFRKIVWHYNHDRVPNCIQFNLNAYANIL